ncbi:MAG: sigma 54-interacting transcriptional regulator [bacterium]
MKTIDQEYQVLKTLGQGLAGEVYLVQKGPQKLALKLLKQTIANLSPEEAAAHFKAEFSILKQLSHPHIAKILDFGTDAASGRHYYTSEFIEGANLYDASRGMGPEQIEELFLQALRALEYLHTHRIPHFDLKPENLLLNLGKEVKIIDFGMAGFRPRGQLAGTPAYMAPEIVLGNAPDTRADLYSLGVTFYECVTGKNPFAAKGLGEMLRRQETLQPPPASQANPKVSAAFSEVLEQLLKKNPAERPATAGAALRLLARLSGRKISLETEATSLSYLPNETKLIGRADAMREFQEVFDAVFRAAGGAPPARLLAIAGAAGLGKSRLLKEIRFHSQLAGVRTLNGEGSELPELHEACCLLYEDLSSEQARRLALSLFGLALPVLAVVTLREEPGEIPNAKLLRLTPFGKKEVREYLSALTGIANPPEKLAEELERRSQGSPRFLTDLLAEAIRRGALFDENGRWSAENIEDLGVDFSAAGTSAALEAAFQADFAKLDQPAKEVLRWMALHPAPVTGELLQAVSGIEDLFYWILELLNQGYLRRDEAAQSYPFANPSFQAWLEGQIAPEDRLRIHGAWAKVLGQRNPDSNDALFHLGRSGAGEKSREALFELARRLSRKGLSQRALEELRLAEPLAPEGSEALMQIQLKIGEELISLNRTGEALEHFDRMRERLKKLPNNARNLAMKVSAYEHLGAAYLRSNALEKAKASFHAGLTLMDEFEGADPVRRLVNENYLGRIHFLEGNLGEAEEIFRRSYQAQRSLSAEQQRGVTNNDLGAVLMARGEPAKAVAQFSEELEFHRRNQNESLQARCLYQLGEAQQTLKDFPKAIDFYRRSAELAKEQKNFEMLLRAYNGLGNVHYAQQSYQESLKYYERALAIAQRIQDFQSVAGIETNIGGILNNLDRLQEAIPHLKAVVDLTQSLGLKGAYEQYFLCSAKIELGDIHRRLKNFEAARASLEEAWRLADRHEALADRRVPIRMTQAKLALDEGQRDAAERWIAELKGQKLDAEQGIELAKLENFLHSEPSAWGREPALTQSTPAAPRAAQSSVFLGPVAESEYAKLLQLTRFINAETNLDFVLKSALQYALELSGAERGLILLLDEREALEVRASINTAVNANLTDISTKVAEQALRSGEIVESDDASQDGRFNEYQSVMILRLRSILCLPIHSRNKTVGVLYLDHRYRPGAFHKDRYPLLQAFCDQAGIAIENAKLFQKYERAQAELKTRLQQAEETAEHYHELLGEGAGKLPTKYDYDNIVARSKAMHEVFKLLDKITETNISVFINGETGTGKELIAKALHYNNKQRGKARFVAINCGGIPPNLIESELFGYKAGAFTGASKDKKGLFLEADGGTIFLDEVAELEMGLQVKLLRALQEGEVIPVGDSKPVKFDVRVISASHKNLEDLIAKGQFREDLFYRICQIRIPLPPLRDRREDIPLLVERFSEHYAQEHGLKKAPKVSGSLMKRLLDYDWPGNIRELENTIRVACALAEGGELTPKALPENFGKRSVAARPAQEAVAASAREPQGEVEGKAMIDAQNRYDNRRTWEDYEKVIFAKAYAAADFKPIGAAQALDVSMATFYKRIKDFDLNDKGNRLYQDAFVLSEGKSLRDYLEDIFWAAFQASGEKAYTAIKWLDVSQGHFYNVLKRAKERHRR